MFDIGFGELLIVMLVALIVLGPKRLPIAIQTIVYWLAKIKQSFNNITTQVEREFELDEVKRKLYNEQILKDLTEKEKVSQNDKPFDNKNLADQQKNNE